MQLAFKAIELPGNKSASVPNDVELKLPEHSTLDASRLHFLVTIPWNEKYLKYVDDTYQDFFKTVLPYLHARTTDVHVATCIPFIKELIQAIGKPVDERVVYAAFILHDSGWSQMTEEEIASSLGVTGLALSDSAMGPKEKHAVLGKDIASNMLNEYRFSPPLNEAQKDLICKAVLYHDKPWELASNGDIPLEVKLVCDVDHLWSFTHENFWQDTVRKGVDPVSYLENLRRDLDGYFVTEEGKAKARSLLAERKAEVEVWAAIVK